MQRTGGVDDDGAGLALDALRAEEVVDDELTPVVFLRCAEKESGRDIGAQFSFADEADGGIDVGPVAFAFADGAIAVELRREDVARQDGRKNERLALERLQYQLAQGGEGGAVFGDLLVVLDFAGERPGGAAAIDPARLREQCPGMVDFRGGEDLVDRQEHGIFRERRGFAPRRKLRT